MLIFSRKIREKVWSIIKPKAVIYNRSILYETWPKHPNRHPRILRRNFVSESFYTVSHEFGRAAAEKIFPQKVTGRCPVTIERQVEFFVFDRQYLERLVKGRLFHGKERMGLRNRLIYAKVPLTNDFFPPEQVKLPIKGSIPQSPISPATHPSTLLYKTFKNSEI